MSIYDLQYSNPTYNMFFLLLQTSDLINRIIEERLHEEDKDITLAQLRLLLILKRHNRPLTSAELSRCSFRKSQTITHTLNQLAKSGYVELTRDQKDKRLMMIHITDVGEQFLRKQLKWMSQAMNEMVSCFSTEDTKHAEDYLERFRHWLFQLSGMDLLEPVPEFDGSEFFLRK